MKYQTIQEIYTGNNKIRESLKKLVSSLTDEQTSALPEGEKWTVAQIVEHISIVDGGAMRICAKLLREAQEAGKISDGNVVMSENFVQKRSEVGRAKLNAPDIVQPTGVRTIPESIAKLNENEVQLEQLKPLFESVDGTELKFPHPFFGELSAQEWLALKGGHEMRHIKQIERLLEKID